MASNIWCEFAIGPRFRPLDLVCHFNAPETGFKDGDETAVLKGKLLGEYKPDSFVARDKIRTVP